MRNTSQFPLNIVIPVVSCDICRSKSFYPPGIWHGSPGEIPPVIHLQQAIQGIRGGSPVFHIVGCTTESETEETAIENGWKMVHLHASIKLVCPDCQSLISECAELWERGDGEDRRPW